MFKSTTCSTVSVVNIELIIAIWVFRYVYFLISCISLNDDPWQMTNLEAIMCCVY